MQLLVCCLFLDQGHGCEAYELTNYVNSFKIQIWYIDTNLAYMFAHSKVF